MTVAGMKKYLARYIKLIHKCKNLSKETAEFPEYRAFLIPLQDKLNDTVADIVRRITDVENDTYRELLIRRYLQGESLESIGRNMSYSSRHISRMINAAVAEVEGVWEF